MRLGVAFKGRAKSNIARVDAKEMPELLRKIRSYGCTPYTRMAMELKALTVVRIGDAGSLGRVRSGGGRLAHFSGGRPVVVPHTLRQSKHLCLPSSAKLVKLYHQGIKIMGFEALKRQSKEQLAKRIRNAAKVTANVVITFHVMVQMKKRRVTTSMVYECLRLGQMQREPEENLKFGTLECRMERYCAGCNCTVIVALNEEYPDLVCVTVWV